MRVRTIYPSQTGRFLLILPLVLGSILLLTACETTAPAQLQTDVLQSAPAAETAVTISATEQLLATVKPSALPANSNATATGAAEPATLAPPATAVTRAPLIYVVQTGDNLTFIAEKFGTTVDAIQRANDLPDADEVYPDTELIIPSAAPTAAVGDSTATAVASPELEATVSAAASPSGSTTPGATAPVVRRILPNGVHCPDGESSIPEGATLVGRSAVCHLPIVSYRLGQGNTPLVLVGGIHGGYEWNSILLAYNILDHLLANPEVIPPSISIYLIPNANPDGLYAVSRRVGTFSAADLDEDTVPGRFNGNDVDLNRNWDCDWTPNATWRDNLISGGSAPFSEAENQALRQYIMDLQPAAVLFWHSAATGVYASGCGETDPASRALADIYGQASRYPVYDSFQYYDVTGDAGDWLASKGNIPSISVELTSHEALNLDMNVAGLEALLRRVGADPEGD